MEKEKVREDGRKCNLQVDNEKEKQREGKGIGINT